jgi:beta-lactam-binding protein with PASTA domain
MSRDVLTCPAVSLARCHAFCQPDHAKSPFSHHRQSLLRRIRLNPTTRVVTRALANVWSRQYFVASSLHLTVALLWALAASQLWGQASQRLDNADTRTEGTGQTLASTTTSITQSGSPGDYTLTAKVVGAGTLSAAPTGTVSFLDTSNGDAVVATATLGGGTLGGLTWTNTQTPATEPAPQSIVVGDFNGDGIPDIAAGSNGYVSILIGNGNGTFKAANNLAALSNNQLMAAAAFETGKPTGILTVSNSASPTDNTQLILSDGSGGEIVEVPFSLPCGSASAVLTADFNGDGKPDFVAACQVSGNSVLAIFLGNGNGTFGAPTIIPTGDTILAIGAGNIRGNGKTDIAVVGVLSGTSSMQTITVYENDGSGNFTGGPSVTSTGVSPTSMVVADFNGDGKSDLALANSGGNNVTILLGDGKGSFTQAASPQTGSSPSSIAVGDFNGDGIPDLAVANSGDNTVTILQGNGDGTFTAAATPPTGNAPSALAVGAFITGGKPGVAVANSGATGGSVTVLNSQPAQMATATATGVSPAGSGAHLVEASYPGDSNYAASVSGTTSLSGAGQVTVPNVVGDTQAAATTAITGAGLAVGTVTQQSSSTVASGDVISESPSAGTSVNSGSAVNLVVSTGSAQVTVPNVVGDTQAAATTAITGAGLVVGTVTTASSSTVASGNVISESPSAGTSVNSGSAVNLVVSTGPAPVTVPNVVGDTQAAATSAIIAAGLAVGTVTTASSSTVASGNVISESPSAGTSVNSGSAVNLVVSTGSAQAPGYTLNANPSSLTIQSGSSASTVITLTPTGGFTGTVNFACGTLPTLVTCTFAPASLTVTSSTPLTTTLTIGTTGTATASLGNRPAGTVLPTLLAALILLPLGFMRRVLRTRKAGSQWLGLLLLAGTCLAAAGLLGTAGCGGSSSSTRAGTYSVPITVTSGSTTVPLNLSITID